MSPAVDLQELNCATSAPKSPCTAGAAKQRCGAPSLLDITQTGGSYKKAEKKNREFQNCMGNV